MKYQHAKRSIMEDKKSFVYIFVDILNAALIIINTVMMFLQGLRIPNFVVCLLSAFIYYLTRKNIPESIIFILSYPLSWLLLIPTKTQEIEDFFNVPIPPEITVKIEDEIMNALPVKTLLLIGRPSEKKLLTKTIVTYVTKGIDIEKNMNYLRALLKDPHMDVALYASQALEDIENYFETNISKTKQDNSITSCLHIYNYLRTRIPKGVIEEQLKELLLNKLKFTTDRVQIYYEMMYYLKGDLNILIDGFRKTKNQELLKKYLIENLRKGNYSQVHTAYRNNGLKNLG
ncbi:MAG: hypothetical protein N2Z58_06740 [Fervidobacterium sp.]|nr:hypothetical protein [Fervidobacterium sp.]